jgi:kynureninase
VYIARSAAELLGGELRLIDGPAELPLAVNSDVGVVCLSHVDFRTGALWPAVQTTVRVHEAGALMLWDVCHSTGALDVDLHAWRADMAVGCGYKYLNGGPGAPAYAFVAAEHHSVLWTPLPGWHGHADPFAMSPEYRPAVGVGQLSNGTPPVLSLLALEDALGVFAGVSTADLRAKAAALTSLFIELVTISCPELDLVSPPAAAERGAQVALRFDQAFGLVQALIERGVIGDFRAPDIARFGFAPAYVRFTDVWDAVQLITDAIRNREYLAERFAVRPAVT